MSSVEDNFEKKTDRSTNHSSSHEKFSLKRLNTTVSPEMTSKPNLVKHNDMAVQLSSSDLSTIMSMDTSKKYLDRLADALKKGEIVMCTQLISECKVDKLLATDFYAATALAMTHVTNNPDTLQCLLQTGMALRESDTNNKEHDRNNADEETTKDSRTNKCICMHADDHQRLTEAFKNRDINTCRKIISEFEAMVTQKDVFGNSYLHLAVKNRDNKIVQILCLEKRPNANDCNEKMMSPLRLSVIHDSNELEKVNLILSEMTERDKEKDEMNKKAMRALFSHTSSDHSKRYQEQITSATKKALLLATENNDLNTIKMLQKALKTGSNRKCGCCPTSEKQQKDIVIDEKMDNTLLHIAAKNGSWEIIDFLLINEYDPISKNKEGQIPLHLAVENGHVRAVGELLQWSRKSVYEADNKWNTALHLAVLGGHTKLVNSLLEACKMAHKRSTICCAALCCCGCCDQHDVVVPLLSRNSNGFTPLHLACVKGHLEIVKALFKVRLDIVEKMVTQVDIKGNSCLHLAVMNGHKEIAEECLWKAANVDEVNEQGLSPLQLAVKGGHTDIVTLLLTSSEKDNSKTKTLHFKKEVLELLVGQYTIKFDNYKSALILATVNGTYNTVVALIDHMSDAEYVCKNIKDENGNSLLHIAADEGHKEIVDHLLKNGYKKYIESTNNNGQIPLHLAVHQGHDEVQNALRLEIVKTLLSMKIMSVCTCDNTDSTPLHLAASDGHERVVDYLIDSFKRALDEKMTHDTSHSVILKNSEHIKTSGQTISTMEELLLKRDKQGSTPLHLACANGHLGIAKILLDQKETDIVEKMVSKKDVYGNTCLNIATMNGYKEIIDLCLEKGANVDTYNNKMMFPIHLAAVNGDVEIVNTLIKDCRIDVSDCDGQTPLHKACEYDHLEIINLLIEKDPNITTIVDKNGRTAYNLAAWRRRHKVVKDMITKDFRNVSDTQGYTPLHIAARNGDHKLVQILLGTHCSTQSRNKEGKTQIRNKEGKTQSRNAEGKTQSRNKEGKTQFRSKEGTTQSRNKEGKTPLHIAAQFGRYEIVKDLVKKKITSVYACDNNLSSALHLAALGGHAGIVKFLIKFGADETKCDADNRTPFERAAESGSKKTIKCFLKARSPSPDVMKSCLKIATEKNHDEIVKMFLKPKYVNNIQKEDIQEALFTAIDKNCSAVVMAIINSQSWTVAMEGCMIRTEDEKLSCCKKHHRIIDTPMRRLIEKMPDVAEIVLTKCQNADPDTFERMKEKLIVGLDWPEYEGISCTYLQKICSFRKLARAYKYNHPFIIMVREQRFKLLNHPLVVEQVKRKWKSVGRCIFYARFLIYLAFVSVFTGFVEGTYAPYTHTLTCTELDQQGYVQNIAAYHCRKGTVYLAFANLVIEVFERIFAIRSTLFNWGNFLESVTYIFSLLLVWNIDDCQIVTGYRYEWQWNLGTAAILLAWVNLVINAQDHPKFGIYGVLVERLTSTFAKFFLVFMMFIIGFALTFRANLQNQPDFVTFWKAMVKTTAMMIGEFTFDDLYTNGEVHYRIVGHIIFFIFMIWMSIFIMNLLIGLAVANISEVQKQADDTRIAIEVELILDIEKNLPTRLRKWLDKTDRKQSVRQQLVKFVKFIKSYLQGTDDQGEAQDSQPDNLQNEEMKEIKNKLTTLEQLMKKQKADAANGQLKQKAGIENHK